MKCYAGGFTYLDTDGTGPSSEALDHYGLPGGRVKATGGTLAYYPYGLQISGLDAVEMSMNEEIYNG